MGQNTSDAWKLYRHLHIYTKMIRSDLSKLGLNHIQIFLFFSGPICICLYKNVLPMTRRCTASSPGQLTWHHSSTCRAALCCIATAEFPRAPSIYQAVKTMHSLAWRQMECERKILTMKSTDWMIETHPTSGVDSNSTLRFIPNYDTCCASKKNIWMVVKPFWPSYG